MIKRVSPKQAKQIVKRFKNWVCYEPMKSRDCDLSAVEFALESRGYLYVAGYLGSRFVVKDVESGIWFEPKKSE